MCSWQPPRSAESWLIILGPPNSLPRISQFKPMSSRRPIAPRSSGCYFLVRAASIHAIVRSRFARSTFSLGRSNQPPLCGGQDRGH